MADNNNTKQLADAIENLGGYLDRNSQQLNLINKKLEELNERLAVLIGEQTDPG